MPKPFYLCKDDQPTPSKTPDSKSQQKPANQHLTWQKKKTGLQHRNCSTGVFLGIKTTIFFVRYILHMWTKRKKKKKMWEKEMERKHIFILFVQKRHMNQDTTGALFTRKQDVGNHVTVFLSFRQTLSSSDDGWQKRKIFFLYIYIHEKASFHSSLNMSREHRKFMEVIQQASILSWCSIVSRSFFIISFCLICYRIPDDCQLWIG